MSYPHFYEAIKDMTAKKALTHRFARTIARRAGLRQGTSLAGARTVIAGFIGPAVPPLARQYLADLSGIAQVRLYTTAEAPLWILRSPSVDSAALNPGDYASLKTSTGDSVADSSGLSDLGWTELYSPHATPARLTISTSESLPEIDTASLATPFAVLLQVSA